MRMRRAGAVGGPSRSIFSSFDAAAAAPLEAMRAPALARGATRAGGVSRKSRVRLRLGMRQDQTLEATIELSADLEVLALSDGARALYGLHEPSIVGQRLADVLMTDSGRIDWAAHWADVLAAKPFEQVMLHRTRSGLRIWVSVRLETQASGARLWARRASGREVLEQRPGALVAAIGKMLAVGGVGLWLGDGITGEFDWSEHALALHDLAPDTELTPAILFGQMHPDDRARTAAEVQRGLAGRVPYDTALRVRRGATEYRDVRVFGGGCYDAEGLLLAAVGGVYDVGEQLTLQRRVRELEEQLRVVQRGDVVGRLAGGIAHDFNNVLTGILGCCEMLGSGALSSGQMEDVRQIRTAVARAADLTRQLLAFGRRQALRRRAVAPALVLAEVLSLLRRTVPANVEIDLLAADPPGYVYADATQLHQVLTNLVVNAAQAMPGGGRIEISAERVAPERGDAAAAGSGASMRFVIEDTGPGVPPELRERIFEPFFSTKPPGQGSGLGLSVVQGIVEQHEGYIRLREGSLGGARFEVYLPMTEQPLDTSGDVSPPQAERAESGRRILVVEDESMVRELTKRILVGAGFEVMDAADGNEALRHAASGAFDVLLTDVVLPAMSGVELVARLREQGLQFHVVYMSGYPADFVESRVLLAESDVLVHKPFTTATLLAAVRRA
jgi:signal transduction histidine kinase